jgi:hypothetical protein
VYIYKSSGFERRGLLRVVAVYMAHAH